MEWKTVESLLATEIEALADEYGLPLKKVTFNRQTAFGLDPVRIPRLELFGLWHDAEALKVSRVTFDRLYGK